MFRHRITTIGHVGCLREVFDVILRGLGCFVALKKSVLFAQNSKIVENQLSSGISSLVVMNSGCDQVPKFWWQTMGKLPSILLWQQSKLAVPSKLF